MPTQSRSLPPSTRALIAATLVLAATFLIPTAAKAATWYLGAFTGSTPSDDAHCGTGKGTHPAPHPCATLAYWTQTRAPALAAGDIVRMTGTFGPAASGHHCIIPRADVTYEGRTADDEQPASWDDAVVDAAATLAYPCHGGAINCRGDSACLGFSRFTLRYITLANANGLGGEGNQLMPGYFVQTGLVIDHVRFTGSRTNGLVIGSGVSNEDNPCDGVRNVRDISIRDSQFDHNCRVGSQAGLWLTCTDGGEILRSTAFDNRGDDKTQAECAADFDTEGCDGRNGFHIGGWINGVMRDSSAHDNGYYNYDFSGNGPSSVCDAPTHHLLVDGCTSYSAANSHYSFAHCNHDITIRNSYAWGHGLAINQYACAYRLRFYNNTFWTPKAVQLFANCRECDFRNNIFRCNTDQDCVYIDFATRHASTTWENNVVVNEGTGSALGALDSNGECVGTPGSSCDCPGQFWLSVCPNSDPQSPGCPSPWKDNISRRFSNTQLSAFVADKMFGDETGSGDQWGEAPAIADASASSESALHLAPHDTIARDAGTTIPASDFGDPPSDWDGERRPVGAAWDVGADEASPATDQCRADLDECLGALGTCPEDHAACLTARAALDASLTTCQASSADCATALATCTASLATMQSEVMATQAALTASQASLTTCQADLATTVTARQACAAELAECRALPLLQDHDQDGRPNAADRCADTPVATAIDAAGCSRPQFCAAFDATTSDGKKRCKKADWDNDEPLMKTRETDCAVAKNGKGTADDRCVPTSP